MAFLNHVQVGIDQRAVAENRVVAAFRQKFFHFVQLAWQPDVVLVCEVDDIAGGLTHGVFKIVRHAVVFVVENLDARVVVALDDFQRIVFRGVVGYNQFVIVAKLRDDAV